MYFLRFSIFLTLFGFLVPTIKSQNNSEPQYLSGSLQLNGNFYIRDSAIGAANIPQYDRQLVGADAWLSLNYNRAGYEVGVRMDVFNNSQLLNACKH